MCHRRSYAVSEIAAPDGIDYQYAERVQQAISEKVAGELRAADISELAHFFVHARIGRPAAEILDVARNVGASLIIVGSNGVTGVKRFVLGSVSEKVVREAECTVEVARPTSYEHVELAEIVDVEPHRGYVPPHRYSYQEREVSLRPLEWPRY